MMEMNSVLGSDMMMVTLMTTHNANMKYTDIEYDWK
jgi:hypothetical protein